MRIPVLLLAVTLSTSPVLAQDRPQPRPLPQIPPPGTPDAALEPEVTITTRGEDKIEEYRIRGRLYAIKVTPSHGKSYYLIDIRGDGQMVRYDELSPNFVVPMWLIFSF